MRITAIVGAGAIGGYIAAELRAGGAQVSLVSRPGAEGTRIRAVRLDGTDITAGAASSELLTVSARDALPEAEIALVAVKSRDTLETAHTLGELLPRRAPNVSLGNGGEQKARLASRLGPRVVGGFVSYNVYVDEEGVRRKPRRKAKWPSSDPHAFGRQVDALVKCFLDGGERIDLRHDIEPALAGKLLLNLQNGICAATGLTLAELFADADARWCFSSCVFEGISAKSSSAQGFTPRG